MAWSLVSLNCNHREVSIRNQSKTMPYQLCCALLLPEHKSGCFDLPSCIFRSWSYLLHCLVLSPTLQLLCTQTNTSLLPITDSSDIPYYNKLSTINSPITRTPLLNGYYSSVIFLSFRPQLLKSWVALSIGKTTIQWISIRETNCAIQWIEIHPVDSVIHLARVVQTLDSAIHRISHCLVDKY